MKSAGVLLVAPGLAAAGAAGCSRAAALDDLRYYPGAAVVGSTAFVGEAFGFPRSAWEQVELRAQAT